MLCCRIIAAFSSRCFIGFKDLYPSLYGSILFPFSKRPETYYYFHEPVVICFTDMIILFNFFGLDNLRKLYCILSGLSLSAWNDQSRREWNWSSRIHLTPSPSEPFQDERCSAPSHLQILQVSTSISFIRLRWYPKEPWPVKLALRS